MEVFSGTGAVGKSQGPFIFEFLSRWTHLEGVGRGRLQGGAVVTLVGVGFRTGDLAMRCRWSGVGDVGRAAVTVVTVAIVVNYERITCPSPVWAEHEQAVRVSLDNFQRDKTTLFVGTAEQATFLYVAEWYAADLLLYYSPA